MIRNYKNYRICRSIYKRDIANIALTKLKMKKMLFFIVPYITALEKVFNLFSKIHKILQRMTYYYK